METAEQGNVFEGRGRTLDDCIKDAGNKAISGREGQGPLYFRLVELQIKVENPITEYRALFIPVT
jgi:hypothetical protein